MARMKIGLMLPMGDDESPHFADLRELALAAEDAGLDSIWAADHLLFRDEGGETTGIHECWTVLSAIAAITTRVEIGPLVLALPFRNPALTAKMAAELDQVSAGRLILGLGCGWHEPEFDAFDYPFDRRVGRFAEALEVLLPMLRAGTATYEGRFHRADDAVLRPGPHRPGGPPILIAGKGPRMLDLVARHADAWNAAWFGRPQEADELHRRLGNLRRALDGAGRDPASLEVTVGIFVAFDGAGDDTPSAAIRGSTEEIAAALADYAEVDARHLIAHVFPRTTDAVRRFGEAAALARERVPIRTG